jgi:transposase-like protein
MRLPRRPGPTCSIRKLATTRRSARPARRDCKSEKPTAATVPTAAITVAKKSRRMVAFMHSRGELLALVRGGETVTSAARRLGIPRPTVHTWKSRDPRSGAALSQAMRANRTPKLRPIDQDAPLPRRDELLRRLDEQSRDGSTRATELLLRALPEEPVDSGGDTARRLLSLVP